MIGDISHFSMVGFPIDMSSGDALARDMQGLTQICEMREISPGDLLCKVRDASGAEILIGLKRDNKGLSFETANPGFDGEGRSELTLVGEVSDPEWKTFERSFQFNVSPADTPIIVEMSDPTEAAKLKPGVKVTVEIAAFSYDLETYRDAKAFADSQKDEKLKFADNFMIPIGMFSAEQGGKADGERPTAFALLAGKVLKSELRSNAAGKGRFWWALVETYEGMKIDVVIDPRQAPEGIKPGQHVMGSFWLTARLAN